MNKKDIWIYGGTKDINIDSFVSYLKTTDYEYEYCAHNVGHCVDITCDFQKDALFVNGTPLRTKAAFIRSDVFAYLESNNQNDRIYAHNCYETIKQFLIYNEDIRIINRQFLRHGGAHKLYNLFKAKDFGFHIPTTIASSNIKHIGTLLDQHKAIQKPISGGEHTQPLTKEILNRYQDNLTHPYFIQERMQHPEIRIYRVGEQYFSFHIAYDGLDYRAQDHNSVTLVENDTSLCKKLRDLTDHLGLDYAAADFMTDQVKMELCFLEVNSFPMFARFDQESDHAISKAIIEFLL